MHVYSDNRMKENYSRCRVQMLFGSPNKTWIRVLMSEQSEYLAPEASQQEVYNTVHLQISRAKEELDSSRLQASAAEIELQIEHQTPWQRQTGYTNYFGHGNKDLVHPLVSLPAQHTLSITDNEMMLSNAMDSLFDKAKSSMLQRSNTVLYLFLSKDLDQAKAPWVRLGKDTEKTYQATWKRLMFFIIRISQTNVGMSSQDTTIQSWTLPTTSERLHVTHTLSLAAHRIARLIQFNTLGQQEKHLESYLLQIAIALFCYEAECKELEHPILSFLAHVAWRPVTQTFGDAADFCRSVSHIVWGARTLFCYNHFFSAGSRVSLSLLHSFIHERSKYLIESCLGPMSILFHKQAYAMMSTVHDPPAVNAFWGKDGTIIISDERIQISILIRYIHTMIKQTTHQIVAIAGSIDWLDQNLMLSITNNLSEESNGFWFGMQPDNQALVKSFSCIERLKNDMDFLQQYATINGDGSIAFKRIAAHHLIDSIEVIKKNLLLLTHMTSGIPSCGPEITSTTYANTSLHIRNFFILHGQVIMITSYHKAQKISGKTRLVCRFLPYLVGRLLVHYLTNLLPFQEMITALAGLKTHSTALMFAQTNLDEVTCRTTDDMTGHMRQTMLLASEGAQSLTIATYRHVAIALARQIPDVLRLHQSMTGETIVEDDTEQDAQILQAGHGALADLTYGMSSNILKAITPDVLELFQKISVQWHNLFGFEPMVLPKFDVFATCHDPWIKGKAKYLRSMGTGSEDPVSDRPRNQTPTERRPG